MKLFAQGVFWTGFLYAFFAIPVALHADTAAGPWLERINAEGISVHTREVSGSPFLEFKARVLIHVPAEKVTALLEDPEKMPLWYHQCVRAGVIENEGPLKKVCYLLVHLPWPVSERDSVFRMVKKEEPQTGRVWYDLSSLPDHIPAEKGVIRVPYLSGHWEIVPLSSGQTEVLVRQHSDPGGWVPHTFVNKLVVDVPFISLKNLRLLLEPAQVE